MEILEIKSAVTEMKHLLMGLKDILRIAEERFCELKKKPQGQRKTKKSTKIQGYVGHRQKSNIYVIGIPKVRKERIVQKKI